MSSIYVVLGATGSDFIPKPRYSATIAIKTCSHVSAVLLEFNPKIIPLPTTNPMIATNA